MSCARIGANCALISPLRLSKSPKLRFRSDLKSWRRKYAQIASGRPIRVGIIGSGPAGFYAAARILKKIEDANVDMYEQLPVPFGLVRYGVAPDHPEVKNCQDKFDEVAQSPHFNFVGNVEIGHDVSLKALVPHYDALLFAYGASQDRLLGIPGEQLKGVLSARSFVGWYNGLPEYSNLRPEIDGDSAVVIGNGNVALDVARILLSGVDALRTTDISEQAIDALSRSKVKRVTVCGRRGPMQAAFTIKEVRELMHLQTVAFTPIDPQLLPTTKFISLLPRLEQRKYRLAKLLAEGSANVTEGMEKSWSLMSLVSPTSFGPNGRTDRLGSVTMTKNVYQDDNNRLEPNATIQPTNESISIPTNLAFRSIGYKSVALQGLTSDLNVSFDDRKGIISNDGNGRAFAASAPEIAPGCYCAGWVKRGPTGVIASTMEDAFASADTVIRDWMNNIRFLNGSTRSNPVGSGAGWSQVLGDLEERRKHEIRPVNWKDWKRIDAAEIQRGKENGKPREKFTSQAEMLTVLQ